MRSAADEKELESMPYVVLASWQVREGHEDEVARALEDVAPLIRGEPGCLTFLVHVSRDDPRHFLLFEEYVDEASFEAHRQAPHVREHVVARILPLLEHRSTRVYRRLAEGTVAAPVGRAAAAAADDDAGALARVVLLRHGEVASHSGDVELTPDGEKAARLAGARTHELLGGPLTVLSSATRRTVRSAELFIEGAREGGRDTAVVGEPGQAFALRNPDLFLAGARVDMVSTPEAFAEQVPGLTAEDCAAVPFFAGFMGAPDRIGWWLRHPSPPGDDRRSVARRILTFARSLADTGRRDDTVVAITHSPIVRAVAMELRGEDPGEPDFFTGYLLSVDERGDVRLDDFTPFRAD